MASNILLVPLFSLVACSLGIDENDGLAPTSVDGLTSADQAAGRIIRSGDCPQGDPLAVATSSGCVLGASNTGGQAFLGIPYAEPPVGTLRFAPPQAVQAWPMPRDAKEYGPICPQTEGLAATLVGVPQSEDCLSLNVWRPDGAEGLPIVFHIHGGSHIAGSGQMTYPGHPALATDTILVTSNYRLGALGFLAHPDLSAESGYDASGNQGVQDNLLALKWIRDNAEAFGGDPDRVLVWGFSAGGTSACVLLESPMADGMFSAVVVESGQCGVREPGLATRGSHDADDRGERFAANSGCADAPEGELACLRAMDSTELIQVQGEEDEGFGVTRDGYVLLEHGLDLIERGEFNRVPIFAGNVSDEEVEDALALELSSESELEAELSDRGDVLGITDLSGLVERYSVLAYGSVDEAMSQFLSDTTYVCQTRALLAAAAPWVDTYGWWFNKSDGGAPVAHGSDLLYWIGDGPSTDATETELGASMSATMRSIAAGQPSVDGIGEWPENGGATPDRWVQFDTPIVATQAVQRDNCDWLMANGLDY